MLHSSSKDAIKKAFEGIGIEFQFSSQEDLCSKECHSFEKVSKSLVLS